MRIKYFLFGLLAALTIACSTVITPSLEISKDSISLASENGEDAFTVTSNLSWKATANVDWISLELVSNASSTDVVEVIVIAENNHTEEARTATVTIKAGHLIETITVTQAARGPGHTWGLIGSIDDNLWITDVSMIEEDSWVVAKGVQFTEVTFKIRADKTWADETNVGCEPGTLRGLINDRISVVTSEYSKKQFKRDASDIRLFGKPGTYDVYFNFEKLEVYVMEPGFKPGEKAPLTPMGDPIEELYIVGDACDAGWSLSDMEAFNNDGIFTWTGNIRAGKQFRFPLQRICDNTGWWPCLVLSVDGTQLQYAAKDGEATYYLLPEDGVYTITVDVREWTNRTVSIRKVGEIEWSYTVAGSLNGGWDLSAANARMTQEGKYYVARNVPMQHGSSIWTDQPSYFLFKIVQTGTWNGYGLTTHTVYGGNAAINVSDGASANIIVDLPEGYYDIYFDKHRCKVWVMYPGQTPDNYEAPSTYTVAGSFNGAWNLTAQNARMAVEGKYYVARNVPMQHGSSYWSDQPSYILFRILETGSWKGYSVEDATVHPGNTAIDVKYGASGNINVDIPEGEYDVYFDKQKLKVWVMTPGRRPE